MKHILYILSVILLSSCINRTLPPDETMYFEISGLFYNSQVDSLCLVEELPRDLDYWLESGSFVDEESETFVRQWMYFKNDSTFYVLTDLDTIADFKKVVTRTVLENKF